MKPYYEDKRTGITIYHGDSLEILPQLGPVETCITDPPYGIGFMGKEWDTFKPDEVARQMKRDTRSQKRRNLYRGKESAAPSAALAAGRYCFTGEANKRFQQWATEWAAMCLKVLMPGGHLIAFGGTRTWHRLACAIEDAGFEIRDTIMWLTAQGFPKSLDISKAIDKAAGVKREDLGPDPSRVGRTRDMRGGNLMTPKTVEDCGDHIRITTPATDAAKLWNGWGTSLKPSWEPAILAMKPLVGTFAENAITHGVAGLNIDGARIPGSTGNGHWSGEDGSDKTSKPGYEGGFCTGGEKHPQGRFPANLILDEEAARMLDEQSGELQSGLMKAGQQRVESKGKGGYHDNFPDTASAHPTYGDRGGASRFFYTAKASARDRNDGYDVKNTHPTVKPSSLMRYLCALTATPTGGTILDPFMGSGTTIVAARDMGRRAIGIEIEEKYIEIAIRRLGQGVIQFPPHMEAE